MPSNAPTVVPGQWIKVGQSVDGYVFNVNPSGTLQVGYNQHGIKAIKEPVVWNGTGWEFKYPGPNGSYLRGAEEAIVKRGPRG
jgi:hypothetical protein